MFEIKRTPARLVEAKRLYLQPDLRVVEAADLLGICSNTLSRWAREEGWPMRTRHQAVLPAREGGARARGLSWRGRTCPGLLDCPERRVQVARAWAAAEAQVDAVAALGIEAPETSARALAVVVRTLKELSAIDAEQARAKAAAAPIAGGQAAGGTPEAKPFHDVDSLRDEIARRLRGLAAEREAGGAGEPDA